MVRVAGHTVANDFSEDRSVAFLRVLEGFEDENARAFTDDKAVAIGVERAAGVRGIVIAGGKSAHGGETADAHGRDRRFCTAADHHLGGATLDDFERVPDGVSGSRASGGGGRVWSAGAIADGDISRSKIHDG